MKKIQPKKIAVLAVCAALAMILSYVETFIPLSFSVPGVKLGLANIAVIFALYRFGFKEAAIVSFIRVFWVAVIFGNLMTLAYSIAGGILSLSAMSFLKHFDNFSTASVSIAGGVMHNIGQILTAMFVMGTSQIIYYLPWLCISGTAAGIAVGIVSAILIKRVPAE